MGPSICTNRDHRVRAPVTLVPTRRDASQIPAPGGSKPDPIARCRTGSRTGSKRHNLRIRGISESRARKWAGSSKGYWRVAGSKILRVSLPTSHWDRLGLKTLSQTWQRLNRTA